MCTKTLLDETFRIMWRKIHFNDPIFSFNADFKKSFVNRYCPTFIVALEQEEWYEAMATR